MDEEQKVTDQYLELYELAVEMSDRATARRVSFITFPFTANTALFGVIATGRTPITAIWLIALAGLIISVTWWVLLRSYRTLLTAKFLVITEMEQNLEVQLFNEEWKRLKEQTNIGTRTRYAELGTVERVGPLIFAVLYVTVLVGSLLTPIFRGT